MKRWLSFILVMLMVCLNVWPAMAEPQSSAPVQPESSSSVPVVTPEPTLAPLGSGSRGDQVLAMQQRLAVLGFFYTSQDGIYGANTSAAVMEFENYLRLLEQDEIDRQAAQTTPEPTATPGIQQTQEADETPEPQATATPTPAPTPTTVADGAAEVELLEILYGDADALYRRDIQPGDEGMDVTRVQRRLVNLNYLSDQADGRYGTNTETATKAFQQAHDLNETGVMDRSTQALLFSEEAVAADHPVYNLLYRGVSGEDVKAVQNQLILLGFMNGKATGSFDEKTENAVKLLESYLHRLEVAANATPSPAPTTEPQQTAEPQATAEAQSSAEPSDEPEVIEGDPETNPYEVLPEESAAPAQPEVETGDGFVPTGKMDAAMQALLLEEGIPVYAQSVRRGDTGEEAQRVQRRLYGLGYLTASGVDGIFGGGSESAVKSFQARNKMEQTGIADQMTQTVLFSEDAVRSIKMYQIKISVDDQRVYVYTHDDQDQYNILVQTFVCSTGTKSNPTPLGTFTNTGPGARWHYFKKFKCWAQYAYYINGDIMFHSVLYSDQDESTLNKSSVNHLGKRASHGCVRLSVEDAKWIWSNCAAGTTVIVY